MAGAGEIDQNTEGGKKLQAVVQQELKTYLGAAYIDDVLPLYIVVMLAHGNGQALVEENLEAFLGNRSAEFATWLFDHLGKHREEYVVKAQPSPAGPQAVEAADSPAAADADMADMEGAPTPRQLSPEADASKPKAAAADTATAAPQRRHHSHSEHRDHREHRDQRFSHVDAREHRDHQERRDGRAPGPDSQREYERGRDRDRDRGHPRDSLHREHRDPGALDRERDRGRGGHHDRDRGHPGRPHVRDYDKERGRHAPRDAGPWDRPGDRGWKPEWDRGPPAERGRGAVRMRMHSDDYQEPPRPRHDWPSQASRRDPYFDARPWERSPGRHAPPPYVHPDRLHHPHELPTPQQEGQPARRRDQSPRRLAGRVNGDLDRWHVAEEVDEALLARERSRSPVMRSDAVPRRPAGGSAAAAEERSKGEAGPSRPSAFSRLGTPAGGEAAVALPSVFERLQGTGGGGPAVPSRMRSDHMASATQPQTVPEPAAVEDADMDTEGPPEDLDAMKRRLRRMELELTKMRAEQREKARELAGASPTAAALAADLRSVAVLSVHFAATPEILSAHFSGCGPIVRVTILHDPATGQPRGSSLMEFATEAGAAAATKLSGSVMLGRPITVGPKSMLSAAPTPGPAPGSTPSIGSGFGSGPQQGYFGSAAQRGRAGPYRGRGYGRGPAAFQAPATAGSTARGAASVRGRGRGPAGPAGRGSRNLTYVRPELQAQRVAQQSAAQHGTSAAAASNGASKTGNGSHTPAAGVAVKAASNAGPAPANGSASGEATGAAPANGFALEEAAASASAAAAAANGASIADATTVVGQADAQAATEAAAAAMSNGAANAELAGEEGQQGAAGDGDGDPTDAMQE